MPLLDQLLPHLDHAPAIAGTIAAIERGDDHTIAAPGLVRPIITAALFTAAPRPTLVVISGEDAAERYARQLTTWLGRDSVLVLPNRRTMPWDDEHNDITGAGRRARALHALHRGREVVVVSSAAALLRQVPPAGAHVFDPLELAQGASLDLEQAAERLAAMGYERTDLAEERGQFAIRGGVIDVFGTDAPYPVRAELFGDEIEELRRYVPSTGQSIGTIDRIELYPAREIALGTRASGNARREHGRAALSDLDVARELELLEQGVLFNGVEAWLPSLYNAEGQATDYLAANALVEVIEPRSLFDDASREYDRVEALAKPAGRDLEGLFVSAAKLDLGQRQRVTLLSLMRAGGVVDAELAARRPEVAGGEDRFVGGVRALMKSGHQLYVTARDHRVLERLGNTLVDAGISIELLGSEGEPGVDDGGAGGRPEGRSEHSAVSEASEDRERRPLGARPRAAAGAAKLALADVPAGFVIDDAALAVVSVEDIYPRAGTARRSGSIDASAPTFQFKPGDYVVHSTHGIALFREIVRRELLGTERDYLLLEYAKGDKLYVPVDQLDRVTKYVGPDASAPRITRLNTSDWSRATGKARTAAKKLAFDLVDLYSRRSAARGFAYGPDTPWQAEMEAMFPFVETPDQQNAIDEVKADMESPEPMDRLVCGDVGYGKTEVAIRAAFKAAQDGKQVMVLCPTTILAQQHFVTFSERFEPFARDRGGPVAFPHQGRTGRGARAASPPAPWTSSWARTGC